MVSASTIQLYLPVIIKLPSNSATQIVAIAVSLDEPELAVRLTVYTPGSSNM